MIHRGGPDRFAGGRAPMGKFIERETGLISATRRRCGTVDFMTRRIGAVGVLLIALAGGGDDAAAPPVVEPPSAEQCVRDTALMTARLECLQNLDCPCGTHCELGECLPTCTSDMDCGTGHCDALGYCD